jgi:hypothetical protein
MLARNNKTLWETKVPSHRSYAPKHHLPEPVTTFREGHLVTHDIWRIRAMQFNLIVARIRHFPEC